MSNYTHFTKSNVSLFRKELEQLMAKHGIGGVELKVGNMRFSETDCKIELTAKIEGSQSSTQKALMQAANVYGLNFTNSQGWKLTDYKSANWKMPFIFERDGKRFKCSLEQAKVYFGKK